MPKKSSTVQLIEKGLPASIDTERIILGSIVRDGSKYSSVVGAVTRETFAIEKHRRIWDRMTDLAERGESIDRVTLANELITRGQLESVDGLGYLVSLDDGMPEISNLDSYVRIVVEKYRLRKAFYAAEKIKQQILSGEYTADQVSLGGQSLLAESTGGYGGSQIERARSFVESYPGGLNVFLDPSKADKGISTGFASLDDITDGFHAGEIFLIGARPGSGKTAIGSNIARTVAATGKPVAIFTMELDKKMFLQRMICEMAFVSFSRFRKGDLAEDDRRRIRLATEQVMEMPLYVDDTSSLTVAEMRVKTNRIQDQSDKPIELVVADYAQLFKPPKGMRFGTENDKFTAIGEGVKGYCKETRIPMLLLSQLNRESERDKGNNKPRLAQARGAGIWEEISFVGACLFREWINKRERDDLREVAELLVEKNRSGPASTVKLRFQPWLMRFSEPEPEAS